MRANGRVNEIVQSPWGRSVPPPVNRGGEMRDQRLVELHHVGNVPIRGIKLQHRELGVMRRIDTFVAEDAADFVDAL